MLKNELLELIKDIEDGKEVDEIILSQGFAKPINDINGFDNLLASNKDIQEFVNSKVKQGIESFKKKDMQKLIDAAVLKRTGNKEETPLEKELREMKNEFESMKKEKARAEMVSKYKDTLSEKKIPSKLIDFVLGEDDDSTLANIGLFENSMKEYIETSVQDRLKGSSYTPPKNNRQDNKITKQEFLNMGFLEQQKFANENPDLYVEIMK